MKISRSGCITYKIITLKEKMSVFLVTYDFTEDPAWEGYDRVRQKLESLDAHQVMDTSWIVSSPQSTTALHIELEALIGVHDSIVTTRLHVGDYQFSDRDLDRTNWFKNHPM